MRDTVSRSKARHAWRQRCRPQAAQHHTAPQPAPSLPQKPAGSPYDAVLETLTAALRSDDTEASLLVLEATLQGIDVVRSGMNRTNGTDDGKRPIHLVIVGVSLSRLVQEVVSPPPGQPRDAARTRALHERLASIAIGAARKHLMEYRGARRLCLLLADSMARMGDCGAADRWRRTVEPAEPQGGAASSSDGFLARCGAPAKRVELQRLVSDLLSRGVAVSDGPLPDAALLAAAEAEAASLHASGQMHASTVKGGAGAGTKSGRYFNDASSRGDVVRWLDGTDGRAPACAALTQWLRGELMDAVREACDAAPRGANCGCGRAPTLKIEPHSSLPVAMLACYPGGGARFRRHVDNSPATPDRRAVTAILYLNGGWRPEHGGALRIYDAGGADGAGGEALEVEPRRGALALFWSHLVPHEVMPASTARFALSLWMCVAPDQPPGWLEGRDVLLAEERGY